MIEPKILNFLDKLSFSECYFVSEPQRKDMDFYEKAKREFVTKFSKYSGTLAIYQIGSVSFPGISDLDMMVIFKDDVRKLPLGLRYPNFLDEESKYCFPHPPAFYKESWCEFIYQIQPYSEPNHLWGKKIDYLNCDTTDKRVLRIITLWDIILSEYPGIFLYCFLRKKIYVRYVLARLGGLKHAVEMFAEIGGEKPEDWKGTFEQIEYLRAGWFNLSSNERLKRLLDGIKNALVVSVELIELFGEFLFSEFGEFIGDAGIYIGSNDFICFQKDWDKKESLSTSLYTYSRTGACVSILPCQYSLLLSKYAGNKTRLGRHIRKRLFFENSHHHPYLEQAIEKRFDLINEYFQYTEGLGTDSAHPFKFGCLSKGAGVKKRLKYRYLNLLSHTHRLCGHSKNLLLHLSALPNRLRGRLKFDV